MTVAVSKLTNSADLERLREELGQKRILLDVSQKRRLARAAARLPRKLL